MKKKDQAWYSGALEILSPLRFHLHEIIEAVESHNMAAKMLNMPIGGLNVVYFASKKSITDCGDK
jgi:hypothetical protein